LEAILDRALALLAVAGRRDLRAFNRPGRAKTGDNADAGLDSRSVHSAEPAAQDSRNRLQGGLNLKTINRTLLGTALALPLAIGTAVAAEPMSAGTEIACTEVRYSTEFLQKFPNAPAACLEAVDKGGTRYTKFNAQVYLNSKDRTTVKLLNVVGDPLSTFSFKSSPDAKVMMDDGTEVPFKDLKVGEKITFWVSETRLTGSELPGSTQESWSVLPPQ
jgi:hypothetical protein